MLDLKKIKDLREKKGWTFGQASQEAGFSSRQQWQNIESGRSASLTLKTLEKIAKALGVKAKDLLK